MAYSKEQLEKKFSEVLRLIEEERFPLHKALTHADFSSTTFYKHIKDRKEENERYAYASARRADSIFEEMLDIADDQENDVYIDKDGNEQTNHNVINRSKVRLDTRKWMLSKMQPKKYGDKLDLTSDGDKLDVAPSITINHNDKNLKLGD